MIYQFCLVNDSSIVSGESSQLWGWLWEQLSRSSSANNAAENMHRDLYLKWAQDETDPFADADDAVTVDDVILMLVKTTMMREATIVVRIPLWTKWDKCIVLT